VSKRSWPASSYVKKWQNISSEVLTGTATGASIWSSHLAGGKTDPHGAELRLTNTVEDPLRDSAVSVPVGEARRGKTGEFHTTVRTRICGVGGTTLRTPSRTVKFSARRSKPLRHDLITRRYRSRHTFGPFKGGTEILLAEGVGTDV
jgi:hypothetical protein